MKPGEIYVGRKVFLKPSEFHKHKYGDADLVPLEVATVGLKRFTLKDPVRSYVEYHIHNLKECAKVNGCTVLLSEPGEEEENFARREKLIISIRRHFNSRAVYNESEETLEKIIDILKLDYHA